MTHSHVSEEKTVLHDFDETSVDYDGKANSANQDDLLDSNGSEETAVGNTIGDTYNGKQRRKSFDPRSLKCLLDWGYAAAAHESNPYPTKEEKQDLNHAHQLNLKQQPVKVNYHRRKCAVAICPNRMVQGGLCISHGAKRKTCNVPGCTKTVKQQGKCSAHGPKRKRCEAEGCTKAAVQGGKCIAHGAKKKCCAVEGCIKQSIIRGMCKRHYDEYCEFLIILIL